jgi:putative tricarboxylic transport membrane protein
LSFAGVYAVSNSPFELFVATGFGILGYVLRKVGVPLIPIMLSFVLARLLEDNFRRALSLSDGDFRVLFATPSSIALWAMAAAALILPFVFRRLRASIKPAAPEM